jgi:beta-lactamase regulating signal transducer with metallopeptidase domain
MNKKSGLKMKMPEKRLSLRLKKEFSVGNIAYFNSMLIMLFVNISVIVLIIIFLKKLPPQVPLFYGLPRGEVQLTHPVSLVYPLVLSSLFLVINSVFASLSKSPFSKKVFVVGGVFISILALITVIRIITITARI